MTYNTETLTKSPKELLQLAASPEKLQNTKLKHTNYLSFYNLAMNK